MAPANRIEIMVQIAEPGTYYLKALKFNQGHPGGARPLVTLANVVVKGRPVHPPTTFPLTLIPPQQDALVQQMSGPTINPTAWSGEIETKPIGFFLDGEEFDPNLDRAGNRDVAAGFSEEWTLENEDVFRHPFQIHVNPFQVLEINGQPTPSPRPWWDTLMLPACQARDANGNCAAPGTAKLLMTFRRDKIGKTVYHCHIIPHEDAGMMAVFELHSGGLPVTIPPVGPFACTATPGACPSFTPAAPEFIPLEGPYVFTQFANQQGLPNPVPASIAIGGDIQLQLPGNSDPGGTQWKVTLEGDAIMPSGTAFVPSVGQFRLANGIYEFNFKAAKVGPVTLRAHAANPFPWDPAHGDFVLALEVVPADSVEARYGTGIFPIVVDPVTNAGTLTGGDGAAIKGMKVTRRRLGVHILP
jgi:hypothetical protein